MKRYFYYNSIIFLLFISSNVFGQVDTSIIDPFSNNSLFLNLPSNSNSSIIYNPEIGVYNVQDKIGGSIIYNSRFFNFKEFQQYNTQKSILDYWNLRAKEKEIKQTGSIWEP